MTEKIKPFYRDYRRDTLFIGFRRDDKTQDEIKFWKENFPKVKIGGVIVFEIPSKDCPAFFKSDFPQLDFETEVI